MYNLTPISIELLSAREDGEDIRHYTFQLQDPSAIKKPEPGQYFILHVPGVGAAPFTFTTIPDNSGIFHALVRRTGAVTQALFDCEPGDCLGLRGPFGKPWPVKLMEGQRILVVAGGCGLAPLTGLINLLIEQQQYEQLALLYGAATKARQTLTPERKTWQHCVPVFNVIEQVGSKNTEDDSTQNNVEHAGLTGTPIDALDHVLAEFDGMPTQLLLCGPETMMRAVANECVDRGISPQSIWLSIERRMHCGVGLCGHCYVGHEYACKDGPTYRWDTLQSLHIQPETKTAETYHC